MSASCSSETLPPVVSNAVDVRRRPPRFSPEALAAILQDLPEVSQWWLAYSGGCDSHVLLHAAAGLSKSGLMPALRVVHVDHGLQPASSAWAAHCAAVCQGLGLPFTLLQVAARGAQGESPEAAARQARYRALAELMGNGDGLMTAHHQDDQAETLLLQLLRGGGPHGLAAMPLHTPFAAGSHARPLLNFARADLRRYAHDHELHWIEDPSNRDTGFDRNFVRAAVMPVLEQRWPAAARSLARGAEHQAEAAALLDTLAVEDLDRCAAAEQTLNITALLALDAARQRNLLRYWLKARGFKLPDSVRLAQIQTTVLRAAVDRCPAVSWPGVVVRRYRDRLYALAPQSALVDHTVLPWDTARPLTLPDGGTLTAVTTQGAGVKAQLCQAHGVSVRYRQGGELCRTAPRAATHTLKHLLQQAGVPPWQRGRIPLIYIGERLAAIADHWVCEPCRAEADEEGIRFAWQRATGPED